MNYLVRRKIRHQILVVLTWLLVGLNLVPIAWMVYCGFKDNNEILSGVVAPGRRENQVILLRELPQGYLAATADGGVHLAAKDDLRILKHLTLGTFATGFLHEGNTLWALSSNRGLQEVDLDAFKVRKTHGVAKIAEAYGIAWKTLWVNDVIASSLVRSGKDLYLAYDSKNSPGVTAFDPATGKFRPVPEFDPGERGPVRAMAGGDSLSLLTRKGLFYLKPGGVPRAARGLALAPDRFQALDSGRMLMAKGNKAWLYDAVRDSVIRWLPAEQVLGPSVIVSAAFSPGRAWLGSSRTAVALALDSAAEDSAGAFQTSFPAAKSSHVNAGTGIGEEVTTGEVTAMLPLTGGGVLLGGPGGALAKADGPGPALVAGKTPRASLYLHWRNYVDLWRTIDFGLYLKNSFIVCLSVMLIAMVMASLGGYALARYRFPGRDTFGYSVLATQMIPSIMLLLPIYLMFINFTQATGLVIKGTYGGLILTYAAYFVPFSIWILRGFFASIPKELEEAALIDGCGPFRAFFRIIVPSAMPGIVATGVFVFLSAWDELMFAWVLTNEKTYTIPVGIRLFVGNYQNRFDLMMAAATVSTLPVLILFFLMQKQIVSGLTAGAVKD